MAEPSAPSTTPPIGQDGDARAAADAIARAVARIEAMRDRIRSDDWATLFRQLRTHLELLADHPFIRGDIEAEHHLRRMLVSQDLEELDRHTDQFADYIMAKLTALSKAQAGKGDAAAPTLRPALSPSAGGAATRRAMAAGPSGDDFAAGGTTPETIAARSRLRL